MRVKGTHGNLYIMPMLGEKDTVSEKNHSSFSSGNQGLTKKNLFFFLSLFIWCFYFYFYCGNAPSWTPSFWGIYLGVFSPPKKQKSKFWKASEGSSAFPKLKGTHQFMSFAGWKNLPETSSISPLKKTDHFFI